jgi:hypothetical protein
MLSGRFTASIFAKKFDWTVSRQSLVPLRFPLPPMMVFAVRIEHTFRVPVQCPHDANPRKVRHDVTWACATTSGKVASRSATKPISVGHV